VKLGLVCVGTTIWISMNCKLMYFEGISKCFLVFNFFKDVEVAWKNERMH
jgi:hypothetical protein